METIMSNKKPTGKEGKALLEKDIQEWDSYMFNNKFFVSSDFLDNEKAIAWGPYLGMLLGDFETIICNYANERKRKYFIAYNNFGHPTCFFDAENEEELQAMWKKEREEAIKKKKVIKGSQTREFVNPRKKLN